ncbi:MAG: crossover junction endodeoxyribonuclease RuvC [Phycisphaerales bacterium]
MRVLGIDPGLRLTGFACVTFQTPHPSADVRLNDAGIVRLDDKADIPARLCVLARELADLIDHNAPELACVEALFTHYQNPRTAIVMAHARGVILHELARKGVPIRELPPALVKKSIAGNGRATKEAVQRAVMVELRLPSIPTPADVADAMAIATVGGRRVLADRMLTDSGVI